jgi:hypothetical protein
MHGIEAFRGQWARYISRKWSRCCGNKHENPHQWALTTNIRPCNKYGCSKPICNECDHCYDHIMIAGNITERKRAGDGVKLHRDYNDRCQITAPTVADCGRPICFLDKQPCCKGCLIAQKPNDMVSVLAIQGFDDLVSEIVRSLKTPNINDFMDKSRYNNRDHCTANPDDECRNKPVCYITGQSTQSQGNMGLREPYGACQECLTFTELDRDAAVHPHEDVKGAVPATYDALHQRRDASVNPNEQVRCAGTCAGMFDRRFHLFCTQEGCQGRQCAECYNSDDCRWPHGKDAQAIQAECEGCCDVIVHGSPRNKCKRCGVEVCINCDYCYGCYGGNYGRHQGGRYNSSSCSKE